jgi:hypothetical protein
MISILRHKNAIYSVSNGKRVKLFNSLDLDAVRCLLVAYRAFYASDVEDYFTEQVKPVACAYSQATSKGVLQVINTCNIYGSTIACIRLCKADRQITILNSVTLTMAKRIAKSLIKLDRLEG